MKRRKARENIQVGKVARDILANEEASFSITSRTAIRDFKIPRRPRPRPRKRRLKS